jgi:uncharacterized membrane protein YeaQ/YmgE (transglycosylase-associated protein family)
LERVVEETHLVLLTLSKREAEPQRIHPLARDFRADLASPLLASYRLAFCASMAENQPKIVICGVGFGTPLLETKGEPMGIVAWIILGLIAGFIGSKIVNKTGEGFFLDIALGVVGAIVGGFIFSLFGAQGVTGLNIWSLIVAVIGAIIVLVAYRMVVKT